MQAESAESERKQSLPKVSAGRRACSYLSSRSEPPSRERSVQAESDGNECRQRPSLTSAGGGRPRRAQLTAEGQKLGVRRGCITLGVRVVLLLIFQLQGFETLSHEHSCTHD